MEPVAVETLCFASYFRKDSMPMIGVKNNILSQKREVILV